MVISHTTFSSGVTNTGTIGAAGISVISGAFLSGGGILDSGTVGGGIKVDSSAKIVASGTTQTAIAVENTATFGGGISNAGIVSATVNGVLISAVTVFTGGISNSGKISAGGAGISLLDGDVFSGGISNAGAISAAAKEGILVSGTTIFSR